MMMEPQLPPILTETAQRARGLMLVTGARDAGLEGTIDALVESLSDFRVHRLNPEDRQIPEAVDVVVADGDIGSERLRDLVMWSEEGRLVILAMRTSSALAGLRRLLSNEFGEGRGHFLWRLADQLTLMTSQMKVHTLDGGHDLAREIILMTPAMRVAVESENLGAADELLKAGEESSGTVSFNQSLLQLLLRRRIDIKTAFESTRDPVHLDQILKKVGI